MVYRLTVNSCPDVALTQVTAGSNMTLAATLQTASLIRVFQHTRVFVVLSGV